MLAESHLMMLGRSTEGTRAHARPCHSLMTFEGFRGCVDVVLLNKAAIFQNLKTQDAEP